MGLTTYKINIEKEVKRFWYDDWFYNAQNLSGHKKKKKKIINRMGYMFNFHVWPLRGFELKWSKYFDTNKKRKALMFSLTYPSSMSFQDVGENGSTFHYL